MVANVRSKRVVHRLLVLLALSGRNGSLLAQRDEGLNPRKQMNKHT